MIVKYRLRKVSAIIPTASMADIAFLLIIFFMLTTSFSPVKTSVDLPESVVRTEVEREAAIVAVTAQGNLVVSDGVTPGRDVAGDEELGQFVAGVVAAQPNKQFIIKADRNVPYQSVDRVLEQLRRNKARVIGLLTEQKVVK
ncbi:MAG: biopolymer transporter ExbD [Acidobacteria bacterium]|nr:biopolymer transporter ExbD [Acidobacteriota bacterium]